MNNEINNSSNNSDLENSENKIDFNKMESVVKEEGSIEEEINDTKRKINEREREILKNDHIYTELSEKLKDLEVRSKVKGAEVAISSREFEKFLDEKLDWDAIHEVSYGGIRCDYSIYCDTNKFWIIFDDPMWRKFKVDQDSAKDTTGFKVIYPNGVEKEVVLGEDRIIDVGSYVKEYSHSNDPGFEYHYPNSILLDSDDSLVKYYEDLNQIDDGVFCLLKNVGWKYDDDRFYKKAVAEFFMRHPEILKHYISVE